MSEGFAALASAIREVRSAGVVSLHMEPCAPGGDDIATIDRFVQGLGYTALGAAWIAIAPEQAARVVAALIARDLAYHSELADQQTARTLAGRFLACFGPGVRCYTNGGWHEGAAAASPAVTVGPSWTPLTGATFDGGVICRSSRQIGIFWVEDED